MRTDEHDFDLAHLHAVDAQQAAGLSWKEPAVTDTGAAIVDVVGHAAHGPARTVTLTRRPTGEVTQHLVFNDYRVAVTDTQVASELGIGPVEWATTRDDIERSLATAVGAPMPPADRIITDPVMYHEAAALSREEPAMALTCGVRGNGVAARRFRLAQAIAVRESWHAAVDAKYTGATAYTAEAVPHATAVPQPFGLGAIIRADGDLERALGDAELQQQAAERLDLNGHLLQVQAFDGEHADWKPAGTLTAAGRRELRAELSRIAGQVGLRVVPGALRSPEPAPPGRPALLPPGVRPLRPEDRGHTPDSPHRGIAR